MRWRLDRNHLPGGSACRVAPVLASDEFLDDPPTGLATAYASGGSAYPTLPYNNLFGGLKFYRLWLWLWAPRQQIIAYPTIICLGA